MVLETFSVSHGKASYLPVIDLLSSYFGIDAGDDSRKRREKVTGRALALDRSLEDTLSYVFGLLGIADIEDPLAQMDGQIKKRRTLEAIKRIMLCESLNQPLIFEDLHWIDEESQAFLNLLADSIGTAKFLLLVNYRPEYAHQWNSKTYYTQLRLDPLGKDSAEEMLATLLDGAELAPLRRMIVEKTEGNPLFMEEIFQALLEDGSLQRNGNVKLVRPVEQLRLPPTVQGILAARIDRLRPEEKDLLQTLAVIGTEFPLSLVRQVVQLAPDHLDRLMSTLQTVEFIYEQPGTGDIEYIFKHALTQEVAYKSMLADRRRLLHAHTAKAIEALYQQRLEDHYCELARHYVLSDDAPKGIGYSQLAADQARDRAAYAEADGLIDAGLRLLDKLPEGEERLRAELGLRASESTLAFILYGSTSPKRANAITRFCEIAERLGEQSELLRGLVNLSSLQWLRGESTLGLENAKRCLELHDLAPEPELLADIYWNAAVLSESCGRLQEAVAHYEPGAEAARNAANAKHPFSPTWGVLHSAMAAGQSCSALQLLGHIGRATNEAAEAFRRARASRHLFTLCHTLVMAGLWLSFLRREPKKMLAHAEELIVLSEQNGFAEWPPQGEFFRGWAMAELGDLEKGVAVMERGIEGMKRLGLVWPIGGAHLAAGYARMGQTDRALKTLEQILAEIGSSGPVIDKPESLRIKGEVLLVGDHPAESEAETCFRRAISVARAQEAKWWELRSTTGLARLLRDTGRRDEACAMLAEIYNWFTEGFDTADLMDAKALLYDLSG